MNIILKITYQSHNCNFNFSAIVGNWKINFMYFISSVWHKYTVGAYVHVTVHDFSWTNYNPWIYFNTQSKWSHSHCQRLEPQISQFDFLLISLGELLVCKVITRFN